MHGTGNCRLCDILSYAFDYKSVNISSFMLPFISFCLNALSVKYLIGNRLFVVVFNDLTLHEKPSNELRITDLRHQHHHARRRHHPHYGRRHHHHHGRRRHHHHHGRRRLHHHVRRRHLAIPAPNVKKIM